MKTCKCCGQEIPESLIVEEVPQIVGYTKRKNGFVGYKTIEIGSPIFEFKGLLYLERENEATGQISQVKYYKTELENL